MGYTIHKIPGIATEKEHQWHNDTTTHKIPSFAIEKEHQRQYES
jgi:hypothetical protein